MDAAGLWGNLKTIREWTVAAMTIPPDFAFLVLQWGLVILGCVSLVFGADPLIQRFLIWRSKRERMKEKNETFRRLYEFARPRERKLVLRAVDGPVEVASWDLNNTLASSFMRIIDSRHDASLPIDPGTGLRPDRVYAELDPDVVSEARRFKDLEELRTT